MTLLARCRNLWSNLTRRRDVEAALDEELRAYLELLIHEHRQRGLSPDDARRAALIECGGLEQVKESSRDAWIGDSLFVALRHVRQTMRALRRSPVFVSTAVITLGLAIGSATALYTVVKGSLLRPLPAVAEPDRLLSVEPTRGSAILYDFSYPDFADYRDQSKSLSGLALFDGTHMSYRDSIDHGHAWVSYVSGEFFSVLGVRPMLGRLLTPADATPNTISPAVVIGYDLWQSHFGGSTAALGATMQLDGYPLTVVGVAPKGFIGAMALHRMEMWVPVTMMSAIMHSTSDLASRRAVSGRLVGRLAPGKTLDDARNELEIIAARLAATYPEDKDRSVLVYAGAAMTVEERAESSRMPRLLAAAVALLLLIACANVANLSAVRAGARARELATRLALGASRTTLVASLVLESGIIAGISAAAGLGVARLIVHAPAIVSGIVGMPGIDLSVDRRVLAIAIAACALTMILVSIAPAIHVLRVPVDSVLKNGSGGSIRRRSRMQRGGVVMQVSASLVLVMSAAILFGAARRSRDNDLGFDVRGVTSTFLDPHEAGLDSAREFAFYDALLERLRREPGVEAAGLATADPPASWDSPVPVFRDGEDVSRAANVRAYEDGIYPGTLGAIGIPILRGRDISAHDGPHTEPVVVVSKRLADALWPNADPIGKQLVRPHPRGAPPTRMTVVGVAGDIRFGGVSFDITPAFYYAQRQHFNSYSLVLVVRGRGGAPIADDVLRNVVHEIEPAMSVASTPLARRVGSELGPQIHAGQWIGAFGVVAVILAAIGLYGVIAQDVLQRTREFAVRTALGATPTQLLHSVIGEGVRLTTVGIVTGLGATVVALRVLHSMYPSLRSVGAMDAALALVVLFAISLLAIYLPGRKVAQLEIVRALRID